MENGLIRLFSYLRLLRIFHVPRITDHIGLLIDEFKEYLKRPDLEAVINNFY